MVSNSALKKGIMISVWVVLLMGIDMVFSRYIAVNHPDVNLYLFATMRMFIAAFVLLIIAGPGPGVKATLKQWHTWAWFGLFMLKDVLVLLTLVLVTATEAGWLQRFNIVMAFVIPWLFEGSKRKPLRTDMYGITTIMVLVFMMMYFVQENAIAAMVIVVVATTSRALETYVMEKHPQQIVSATIQDRARVSGAVIGFSSAIILFLAFLLSAVNEQLIGTGMSIPFAPNFSDFLHPQTVIFSFVSGIIIMPWMMYLFFKASVVVKTERFLIYSSALPFTILAFELIASHLGFVPMRPFSWPLTLLGIVVTAVAILMVKVKNKVDLGEVVQFTFKERANLDQVKELIILARTAFDGNAEAAASALEIPEKELRKLLAERKSVTDTQLAKIANNYSFNVAMLDPLTGLMNRMHFKSKLIEADNYKGEVSVLFMDLNKFKPINDTYGHEAGDDILKGITKRIQSLMPKDGYFTRIGGDEFSVLLYGYEKEELVKFIQIIKDKINEPFHFDDIEEPLIVGVSIGYATSSDHVGSVENLYELSDKAMYEDKRD